MLSCTQTGHFTIGAEMVAGAMATFEYSCERHGGFEIVLPMGQAQPTAPCPECAGVARRRFRAPMLSLAPRRLVAAIDRAEQSREQPSVVTAVPPRAGPRGGAPPTPPRGPQRLPRP